MLHEAVFLPIGKFHLEGYASARTCRAGQGDIFPPVSGLPAGERTVVFQKSQKRSFEMSQRNISPTTLPEKSLSFSAGNDQWKQCGFHRQAAVVPDKFIHAGHSPCSAHFSMNAENNLPQCRSSCMRSGCHCTPTRKMSPSNSMASMTSPHHAETLNPRATCRGSSA